MINKKELLKELKEKFEETKKNLGFKATYEEINSISYLEEMVFSQGYVSEQFSRQMINRIIEKYYSWLSEFYSWLYPQPPDAIHINESKKLSSEERKELLNLIERIMYLIRKNKRIVFEGLKKEVEGKFIDELVEFDKKYFTPILFKFNKKFEDSWKEEMSKEK
ncbi:MAG: hypothetical protein QXG18_02500 [Candidatus Pacearchaeota archaeon]